MIREEPRPPDPWRRKANTGGASWTEWRCNEAVMPAQPHLVEYVGLVEGARELRD